jgi:hypothetical protein
VAIAAINSKLAGVVPVAEGNGLLARNVLVRVPRRQRNLVERKTQGANDQHGSKNTDPRDQVCTAMEYLCH